MLYAVYIVSITYGHKGVRIVQKGDWYVLTGFCYQREYAKQQTSFL